jgi:hypothetical protein
MELTMSRPASCWRRPTNNRRMRYFCHAQLFEIIDAENIEIALSNFRAETRKL